MIKAVLFWFRSNNKAAGLISLYDTSRNNYVETENKTLELWFLIWHPCQIA